MDDCAASLFTQENTEACVVNDISQLQADTREYEHRPSASKRSAHHAQLPLIALSSGAQELPVALTSTSFSPVPSDVLQWLPATLTHFLPWVHLCTGASVAHAIHHRKVKALDFRFPQPGVDNLQRLLHPPSWLHLHLQCLFCGLLTSHLRPFPGPAPGWPPTSFPPRPL